MRRPNLENIQGKLIEILIILMNEINHRGIESRRMEILSGELLNRGYSEREISTAFSWVLERMNVYQGASEPDPRSFRVLHDIEKVFISTEAYGYLLQLNSLGLVTVDEMERIIERAMMESNPNLRVDDIKSIVVEVLFDESDIFGFDSEGLIPEDLVH